MEVEPMIQSKKKEYFEKIENFKFLAPSVQFRDSKLIKLYLTHPYDFVMDHRLSRFCPPKKLKQCAYDERSKENR
jgi:hypothetical protein